MDARGGTDRRPRSRTEEPHNVRAKTERAEIADRRDLVELSELDETRAPPGLGGGLWARLTYR